MTPWVRLAGPTFKNTGSTARDHLASERTYLAWTRTGLGCVTLGIAIERFSRLEYMGFGGNQSQSRNNQKDGKDESSLRLLAGTLVTVGTVSMVYATRRYFTLCRLLSQGNFRPAYHGAAAMGAVMGALGAGVSMRMASTWLSDSKTAAKDDWGDRTQGQKGSRRDAERTTQTDNQTCSQRATLPEQ